MKNYTFIFLAVALGLIINGCKQNGLTESPVDHYKKLYHMAAKNGDQGVMANCIYNILLVDSMTPGWRDSLVQNMSARGLFEQAHKLAERRINAEPKNKILLTVEGMYARASGKGDDALKYYKMLNTLYPDPDNTYQLAVIYFSVQKVDSCELLTNKAMQDPGLTGKTINVETGYSGQVQRVKAQAALLNLKGAIAQEHHDTKMALTYITQALQIEPDFQFAQQLYQTLSGGARQKGQAQ